MAINKLLLIILLLIIYSCSGVKNINNKIELSGTHQINIDVKNAVVDNLDQLHIITQNNTLIKYDQELNELYRFADNTLGSIQTVDVSNPLSTLVYHGRYNTINYLDNTLALVNKQNIEEWNVYDVSTIAASNDGKVWLYDPSKNQIIKVDDSGEIILSSNNLNDYNIEEINPNLIIEKNNLLFIQDDNYGIIIFDNLGQYIKVLPIVKMNNFQTDGNNLFIYQENKIAIYTIRLLEESTIDIPLDINKRNPSNVLITAKSFFMIYPDGVDRIERN